ncbi:hypothetical protein HUU53_04495 [Candidatus Micrarchaeota archaeon]|nr:hypothetical protein [Candidatus Micrarchaeota archaeon]
MPRVPETPKLPETSIQHLVKIISTLNQSEFTPATLREIHRAYHEPVLSRGLKQVSTSHSSLTEKQLELVLDALVKVNKIKKVPHSDEGFQYKVRRSLGRE